MTWTFDLPWEKPPLSANKSLHWARKKDLTKAVRSFSFVRARNAHVPPMDRCRVTLTWFVNTRHRRDADNLVPTLKPLCDGLVDAGVVLDDTPDLMDKLMPVIVYRPGVPMSMTFTIEEIEATDAGS